MGFCFGFGSGSDSLAISGVVMPTSWSDMSSSWLSSLASTSISIFPTPSSVSSSEPGTLTPALPALRLPFLEAPAVAVVAVRRFADVDTWESLPWST